MGHKETAEPESLRQSDYHIQGGKPLYSRMDGQTFAERFDDTGAATQGMERREGSDGAGGQEGAPGTILKVPVECWTRVVGYYRPVEAFNIGKQQEFEDRVTFKLRGEGAAIAAKGEDREQCDIC